MNWLKYLKLAKSKNFSLIFLKSLKDWSNVFRVFIYKLLIELCASLKMTIFSTFLKLIKAILSLFWFQLSFICLKLTGIKSYNNLLMLLRQFWKKLILKLLKRPCKRKTQTKYISLYKIQNFWKKKRLNLMTNGKLYWEWLNKRIQTLKNLFFHTQITML